MLCRTDDDDDNAPLTEEEIEAVFDQLPPFDQMTPLDAATLSCFLLDMEMPVPVDLIAKAHSGGIYFAH